MVMMFFMTVMMIVNKKRRTVMMLATSVCQLVGANPPPLLRMWAMLLLVAQPSECTNYHFASTHCEHWTSQSYPNGCKWNILAYLDEHLLLKGQNAQIVTCEMFNTFFQTFTNIEDQFEDKTLRNICMTDCSSSLLNRQNAQTLTLHPHIVNIEHPNL